MLDVEGAFVDEANDILVDLFECKHTDEPKWLVFYFHETCVETADVFENEAEANAHFDEQAANLQPSMPEYDPYTKITMCTLCGIHIKPVRIVMLPLSLPLTEQNNTSTIVV